jgi:hypothetical protein
VLGARHGGVAWGLVMQQWQQHCGITAEVTRLG